MLHLKQLLQDVPESQVSNVLSAYLVSAWESQRVNLGIAADKSNPLALEAFTAVLEAKQIAQETLDNNLLKVGHRANSIAQLLSKLDIKRAMTLAKWGRSRN